MTTPINEIIPREIPKNIVPIINWFADTLEELVNFGSHILIWDTNPQSKGEENIPPTMLFRHFLDLVDSISILVRHSSGDPAKLLLRGVLETMLYIEYMFEKDTSDRAMAFLVAETLIQMKAINKLDSKSEQGKDLHKTFKEEKVLSGLVINDMEIENFLQSKTRLLNLPQFKKAFEESERLKKMGKKSAPWYSYFDGPKNIEALAKHLKQRTFYEILYRKWSGSAHGTDIYIGKVSKSDDDNRVDIVQLRYVKDVQEVTSYSFILGIKILRLYVKSRIPEKNKALTLWYLSMKETIDKLLSNQYIVTT